MTASTNNPGSTPVNCSNCGQTVWLDPEATALPCPNCGHVLPLEGGMEIAETLDLPALEDRFDVNLSVNQIGEITVVRFGPSTILDETNIQEVGNNLTELVETHRKRNLLLNMSNVIFLSSTALGKLISLQHRIRRDQGKLVLCGLNEEINEIFEVTRLISIFDVQPDEKAALAAFQ